LKPDEATEQVDQDPREGGVLFQYDDIPDGRGGGASEGLYSDSWIGSTYFEQIGRYIEDRLEVAEMISRI
jgi:hypothetical protein